MGANWLHGVGGPKRNPLYEMSEKIHLKKFYSDFNNVSLNTYKQEGGRYKENEVDAAFSKADKTLDDGEKFSKVLNSENNGDDMSILSFERLQKTDPRSTLEKMVDFFTFDGEQAEAPRVTSLRQVLPMAESHDFGENSYFVADSRGFESLVHLIAKQFISFKNGAINDPRVKFNQAVTEIDQSKGGVTVKTEDGKQYHAKLVILSPSLGVLQSELITYKPQLPLWNRRAISEFSIGVYTKIFLKFPRTFWPVGNGTEFFLYVHERRGYYAIWQHLDNEYPGSNVMFVTLADDEAIRVEQQSDEETKAEAMEAPFGKIYFTGEHTHPRLFGYADGAYYSGADTAKDVIKCLRNKSCSG
uniref:Amine oxidase domain-containing protein n=1 Tax=Chenopodium quinoa TaxID=63459 RepID=A0A803L8N4_CHEQI